MRDYKFRVWINSSKTIEYLDFLNLSKANFCGNWEIHKPEHLFDVASVKGNLFNFDEVELMQFTGCLDRNGVEIFEGDILKLVTLSGTLNTNASVIFKDSSFGVDYRGHFCSLAPIAWDSYEVIGNIYEHSNLLLES